MSKKLSYFAVGVDAPEGMVVFYARDTHAMNLLFGWGGTSDQIEADFYGRGIEHGRGHVVPPTKGKLSPGDIPWSWTFGPEHARRMLGLIEKYKHDINYYDKDARKRLPDFKALLHAIAGK
jgi:hypothetical protein